MFLRIFVIYIYVIYIPLYLTIKCFEIFLERFTFIIKTILILGDFNISLFEIVENDYKFKHIDTFIEMFSVCQHNNVPNQNERYLDLVLSSVHCDLERDLQFGERSSSLTVI